MHAGYVDMESWGPHVPPARLLGGQQIGTYSREQGVRLFSAERCRGATGDGAGPSGERQACAAAHKQAHHWLGARAPVMRELDGDLPGQCSDARPRRLGLDRCNRCSARVACTNSVTAMHAARPCGLVTGLGGRGCWWLVIRRIDGGCLVFVSRVHKWN